MNIDNKKTEIIKKLIGAEKLYGIMSLATKLPFISANEKTADNEIFLFDALEYAYTPLKKLKDDGNTVDIFEVDKATRMPFFALLCTVGITSIIFNAESEEEDRVPLNLFVKSPKELPETGQDWFENPELQLKAAYFMQDEARNKVSDVLGKKQEEITKIFNEGTFLVIYNETGELPVVRFEDHTRYVPVFTDLFAARQFATDGQVKLGALPGDKIPSILPPETEGVIINPNTLCLRLNLCNE